MKPQSIQPLALVIYGIINCLCCRAWKQAGWVADTLEYLMPAQRTTARGWQAKVVDNGWLSAAELLIADYYRIGLLPNILSNRQF